MAVEVFQHSIKPLYLFYIPWSWPVSDHCTFGWVVFQAVVGDLHPKEDDLILLVRVAYISIMKRARKGLGKSCRTIVDKSHDREC